ncbi:MAG TPA: 4-hydroxyphenylpyruvate dioxygenase, partial [Phenylobacterium sp.]|nr:4-hydroxyphenylpyruvate dioxygenase [Phenylobacterium sp.]
MVEITAANPMGTDGFEFVEFTSPDPKALEEVFTHLGFRRIGRHRSKKVTLWRQGDINLILNAEDQGPPAEFAAAHGPSANAMAFRVKDAAFAYKRALELGAKPYETRAGAMELNIPAIEGIGGTALYFVDRYGDRSIYDVDFELEADTVVPGAGLKIIDHLTHNVRQGQMDRWYGFYNRLFNFREIRFFDIEGKVTGLKSRALTSPDGAIRIPINESAGGEQMDQIEEFIHEYKGEGIQHIALSTDDAYASVMKMREFGMPFQDPPPETYYEMLEDRLPGHGEDVDKLRELGLLVDGPGDGKKLLQIFTQTCIGPIFFEVIQRKRD